MLYLLTHYGYVMLGGGIAAALTAVIAYFLGCSNGAVIISKYIIHDDVRTHGSGNAGLTNFFRTFGGPLTLAVILIDVLKAVLAVWIGGLLFRFCLTQALVQAGWEAGSARSAILEQLMLTPYDKYWAGLFCLLGHMFPCMFHFKGGKGILSGGTIAIMIDWRIALVVWGGFLLLTILTRYVSLGSIWAGGSFPFATWFVYGNIPLTVLAVVIGWGIVYMHRANIKRLLKGEENKLSFHKKKEGGQ